jgi:surface polysaccharide O-acyltransferase-like enzyme
VNAKQRPFYRRRLHSYRLSGELAGFEVTESGYTKRLSRILIPIIFWSAFFLAWAFFKSAVKGNELTVVDLAKMLLSGKPHYHMWFLYMIISLYLFTPFFRKVVAHSSKKELLVFIAIAFVLAMLNYAYGAPRKTPITGPVAL